RGDVFGGITAGIVALPLALAFGVQSGMGAIAGLYGAMILGIIAAVFGGTATQVSGPTGPMTVISAMVIATAIEVSGSLQAGMGIIIASFLLAGGFQILLGILKIGKYIKYLPYPVLSGFMTGIGVIIILYQLYPLIGLSSPRSTVDILLNIGHVLSSVNWDALGLGLLTILIIYLFPKFTKAVPSTLVALLVVTVFATLAKIDVPVIGTIPAGLPKIRIEEILSIDPNMFWTIIEFAGMLAALGAIDSLLTSVIADNITKTKHNSNRELIGQGIGNMAAAIIGGLPGAGATMRTVVNVNAGGKTRLSGLIHGLLLVVILLGLGNYASHIPLSVLAGILITVGIGIIDYKGLRHIRIVPRADAIILIIVLLITVFGNLLHAVGVGIVLACVLFMKKMSDVAEEAANSVAINKINGVLPWEKEGDIAKKIADKIYVKHLDGPLSFGFEKLTEMVKQLPSVEIVIIRMREVPYMDQSGLYAVERSILTLEQRGIIVCVTGLQPQPEAMMRKLGIIPLLVPESYVFPNFRFCAKWLKDHFEEGDGFETIRTDFLAIKKAKVAYQM
ncbi:MAG: SulP family inorganic anion transporter, partial [Flavobacteriales bacterium]|nr:SulP family inorganic anion transporter [Flavobacteriales bacterium]